MRDYYILKGEASDGPYTLTELQDLFLRNIIGVDTPVDGCLSREGGK